MNVIKEKPGEGLRERSSGDQERALLRSPHVAWWTLCLFVSCVVVWGLSMGMVLWGGLSMGVGLVLMSAMSFVAFTPMHDASHRSIAKARWINEVVGRCCAFLLASPFLAFKYVHLEHHKHTNDEEKDPDYWSGQGPVWLLPLRWLSQDLHYYVVYLRRWSSRPFAERWEIALSLVVIVGCLVALGWWGAWDVMLMWLLPARFAIAMLAYSFDYLPHKPHHIRSSENRYKATLVRPNPLLTPLFLYQNYHLIHHLYPGLPFYRYGEVWRAQKDRLIEQGVEVRSLWGRPLS